MTSGRQEAGRRDPDDAPARRHRHPTPAGAPPSPAAATPPIQPVPLSFAPATDMGESGRNGDVSAPVTLKLKPGGDLRGDADGSPGHATPGATAGAALSQPGSWPGLPRGFSAAASRIPARITRRHHGRLDPFAHGSRWASKLRQTAITISRPRLPDQPWPELRVVRPEVSSASWTSCRGRPDHGGPAVIPPASGRVTFPASAGATRQVRPRFAPSSWTTIVS